MHVRAIRRAAAAPAVSGQRGVSGLFAADRRQGAAAIPAVHVIAAWTVAQLGGRGLGHVRELATELRHGASGYRCLRGRAAAGLELAAQPHPEQPTRIAARLSRSPFPPVFTQAESRSLATAAQSLATDAREATRNPLPAHGRPVSWGKSPMGERILGGRGGRRRCPYSRRVPTLRGCRAYVAAHDASRSDSRC